MSWAKFDDQFPDHPKVKSVGAIGLAIQVSAICYSARYLTDGLLTYSVADGLIASLLSPTTDPDGRIWTIDVSSGMSGEEASALDWPSKMVASGLWELGANGYLIHDYLDYNPTGTHVKTERLAAKTRMNARRHVEQPNNIQGSSPEVRPKFARSSSSPSPSLKKKEKTLAHSDARNGFDSFWQAYPKKLSKAQAEKIWTRLKPNEDLQRTIMAAVTQAKHSNDWTKDGGKFIPHPATWLNNRRWEDELLPPSEDFFPFPSGDEVSHDH